MSFSSSESPTSATLSYKEQRIKELFADSDAVTLAAIKQGRTTRAEIIKYEKMTGEKVSPYYHERAAERMTSAPVSNKRSWPGESDDTNNGGSPCQKSASPPSKRRKTASERKERRYVQRSTRDGCLFTCISRDSHDQMWPGRKEDMDAFEAFADETLSTSDDLNLTVEGKDIRQAYEEYLKSAPGVRRLSPNVLGCCCGVQYCKTDVSHKVKYHGVKIELY